MPPKIAPRGCEMGNSRLRGKLERIDTLGAGGEAERERPIWAPEMTTGDGVEWGTGSTKVNVKGGVEQPQNTPPCRLLEHGAAKKFWAPDRALIGGWRPSVDRLCHSRCSKN